MQDPRNFKFSSDYTLPTYAKMVTCQVTTTPNQTTSVSVNTGLGFTPLVMGMWSTDSNFTKSFDITVDGFVEDISSVSVTAIGGTIKCDVSSGFAKTVYFKIYCMIPPGEEDFAPPVFDTSNFMFNSEDDYLQVYKSGFVKWKDYPTGVYSVEVPYVLDYIPKFRVWASETIDGEKAIWPVHSSIYEMYISPYTNIVQYIMNSNKLVLRNFSRNATTDENAGCYYQIYTEEA